MQEQRVAIGRGEPVDRGDHVGQQLRGRDRVDDVVADVVGGRVAGVEARQRTPSPRLGATVPGNEVRRYAVEPRTRATGRVVSYDARRSNAMRNVSAINASASLGPTRRAA